MRVRFAAFAGAVLVFALGACGDDDVPPRAKRAKPPPTLTPSLTGSLTELPPPLPTDEPAGAPTPDQAARTLHDQWVAGDSTAALETATQQAVNELFAHPGNTLDFQGCIREGSEHTCFFYYEGGGLNMIVRGSPGRYLVTRAFFVAD